MKSEQMTILHKLIPEIFKEECLKDPNNLQHIDRFIDGIKSLIELCGDNPERDGLNETPYRVLKAFIEYTSGYREQPELHLSKIFSVNHEEVILVKDIEFHSTCEHHFAPFFGVAHVGYIPTTKITGLSKIARMVEGYAKRFQVQERLSQQIVMALQDILAPQGAMVMIEAKHMCMCSRGIRKTKAMTVTTATSGVFKTEKSLRQEFLSLVKKC
jgi:GTP cyclohydrolase I